MLHALRPEDLESMGSNIHAPDIHSLAGQVVFEVMSSPKEAGTWSRSLVALMDKITEPDAHDKGCAEPLGGSSGPGKALRFALVQECMEVFEMIMATVDYVCFLPHSHPEYIQAHRNLSAFGQMLCAFVNWKVVRDTMLHRGLQRLFSILPYQDDMSVASVEVAADILQAVEPWMEVNWGYTSLRYLDAFYHKMQRWCHSQISLSKTPEGCFVDVRFSYDILDNVVTPKLKWIDQQRDNRAATLPLPAVDVAASEALGRSRVPPLPMELTTAYMQPTTHLPVQQPVKTEQEYSGEDGPSYFAYPLLPVDHTPAAVSVPWTSSCDAHDQEASLDSAMLPVGNLPENFPAAHAPDTFDDTSATAAAPAPPAAAFDPCIETTASGDPASRQISMSEPISVNATPANTSTSSDSPSSRSSESMFVPRSCASSGSSHSSSGDAANSPETSNNSTKAAEDAANSSSSSTSPAETPLHAVSSDDTVFHRSLVPTYMKKTHPMGDGPRSSQAMPTRHHSHKHAHQPVQQVPVRNSSAQLDPMSSSHPEGDPTSDFLHSAEDAAALKEAVSRALQEFMLSHDAADFVESFKALLSNGNAAGVLQTLLQSASTKLEQLTKPKPFSDFTRLPRSRKALQRHFAEQRDRLFCKGGIIDPLAYHFNQHGPAKGRRSGLGFQIPPSNPGYKLMTRWGWEEGRGLGANLQGRTEPCLPAFQPLDPDNAKQGLGERRYKGILPAPAAAVQLRDLLVNICSGENAVLGEEEVQQGLYAFLTNSAPCATPHAPPLRARALCWVGSLLGALVYKAALGEEQASDLVYAAASASCEPGSSNTPQRLANNMWSAVGKQTGACQRADEQAQEAKQTAARQLAELHQPRAPTKKTTYVQGAEGKALKIRIKQYGGSSSAAPSSDGRVSWE